MRQMKHPTTLLLLVATVGAIGLVTLCSGASVSRAASADTSSHTAASSRQLSSSPQLLNQLQQLLHQQQHQQLLQSDDYQYQSFEDQLAVESVDQQLSDYSTGFQPYGFQSGQHFVADDSHKISDVGHSQLQRLDQVISGLEDLASLVPIGQQDSAAVSVQQSASDSDTTSAAPSVPIIDPGLFVIQGVQSCGDQNGYCMLGSNCTSDTDFLEDSDGHCRGLRSAFSPPADFICCKYNRDGLPATQRTTPTTTEGSTFDDGLSDSIVNFDENSDTPHQLDENSHLVDIVAIITDSTGIVDLVTRPYNGPWPPNDEEYGQGVTLPFAKPGETFDPNSLAGLNRESADSITTPTSYVSSTDHSAAALSESDKSAAHYEAKIDRETLVTLRPATEAPQSADAGLGSGADELLSVRQQPDSLSPLASIPVMSQDLDYIGELDYDAHLLPALLPVQSDFIHKPHEYQGDFLENHEGSGSMEQEDIFPLNNAPHSQYDNEAINLLSSNLNSTQPPPSKLSNSHVESSESGDEITGKTPLSRQNSTFVSVNGNNLPSCGIMGSTLANLLSQTRYTSRHFVRGGRSSTVTDAIFDGDLSGTQVAHVTSTVVWCWMAAVMRRTHQPERPLELVCTGTLVQQDLVLTSASCASRLMKQPLRDFIVLLGASSLHSGLDFGTQRMEPEEIVVHEDFQMNDGVHYNDVGMIKLSRHAVTSRTVCRLCLPPENMELQTRQSCTATGYGLKAELPTSKQLPSRLTDTPTENAEKPGVLRQVTLPVVPSAECSAVQELSSRNPLFDTQSFICAAHKINPEVCLMVQDDGSPVACMAPSGRYYLYGLVSSDHDCRGHLPQTRIYTNVAKYFSWITGNYERLVVSRRNTV